MKKTKVFVSRNSMFSTARRIEQKNTSFLHSIQKKQRKINIRVKKKKTELNKKALHAPKNQKKNKKKSKIKICPLSLSQGTLFVTRYQPPPGDHHRRRRRRRQRRATAPWERTLPCALASNGELGRPSSSN